MTKTVKNIQNINHFLRINPLKKMNVDFNQTTKKSTLSSFRRNINFFISTC